MSSLIVIAITPARDGKGSADQISAWVIKRISDVFNSLKRKFETLSQRPDKISRLFSELESLFQKMISVPESDIRDPDSARKRMESFFRKTDRLRISLIQLLLEENDARLLEQMLMDEIRRLLSESRTLHYLGADNPRYLAFQNEISRPTDESQTERLSRLKRILHDLGVLFYTCELRAQRNQNRIAQVITLSSSLQLQPVSISDLEKIQNFSEKISLIRTITDIARQEKALTEIEDELSETLHHVSGLEHTDLTDLKRNNGGLSETELRSIEDRAVLIVKTVEANFYHERIQFFDYDNTENSDYGPVSRDLSPDQLALQRENLQLEYGLLKEKLPEKTVIREQLEEIIQNLSLEPDAGSLLDAALILFHEPFPEFRELVLIRRQYDVFYLQKAEKSLSNDLWESLIKTLLSRLQERGYRLPSRRIHSYRDALHCGVMEIFSPILHYSVLISINPLDELVFRLVRVVDTMDFEDLDSEEMQRQDMEAAGIWDHDFDVIIREMQEETISFIERLRKGPAEVPVQQLTRFDLFTDEHIS